MILRNLIGLWYIQPRALAYLQNVIKLNCNQKNIEFLYYLFKSISLEILPVTDWLLFKLYCVVTYSKI